MLNPLKFLSKIIKSNNQKELDRLNKITKKINELEDQITKLEDKSFPEKTRPSSNLTSSPLCRAA